MRDVEVVFVTPVPPERLAFRDALEIGCVYVVSIKHLLLSLTKIAPYHADDLHLRVETRRKREMRGRATEHFFGFTKRRLDCIKCDRTDYKQ